MNLKYFTTRPVQTKQLGNLLAKEILKSSPRERAVVIGLEGDLGGGKTTFLQGFAKGLGIKQRVLSPTFVIFKKFLISRSQFLNFYHIDCYRIQKGKELLDLGFKEIISDSKNIVAVEWADRVKEILPKDTLILKFQFLGKNKREIEFSNFDKG